MSEHLVIRKNAFYYLNDLVIKKSLWNYIQNDSLIKQPAWTWNTPGVIVQAIVLGYLLWSCERGSKDTYCKF